MKKIYVLVNGSQKMIMSPNITSVAETYISCEMCDNTTIDEAMALILDGVITSLDLESRTVYIHRMLISGFASI